MSLASLEYFGRREEWKEKDLALRVAHRERETRETIGSVNGCEL